jgi:tetratricopeptide (TPR) repeat protein
MLWQKASQGHEVADYHGATAIFSAAFQYCGGQQRGRAGRMLSSCCFQLGQYQRAMDYARLAADHEEQPSVVTHLLQLQAAIALGDVQEAISGEHLLIILLFIVIY